MPILDVELVVDQDEHIDPTLAQQIADSVGEILHAPAGEAWVKLRRLPRNQYAENGNGLPVDVRPVFVSVLHAHLPPPDHRVAEAEQISICVAKATGRARESVHVIYLPDGHGRIAFGGKLLK